jgi:hypothetical protein
MNAKGKRCSKKTNLSSSDRNVKTARSNLNMQNDFLSEDVKYTKFPSENKLVVYDERTEVVHALKCVGEDDPALMLDWNFENVDEMVNALNANPPQVVPWLGINNFPITADKLIRAIVDYAAAFGGGSVGRVLFAPNDFRQYSKVVAALMSLCHDPVFVGAAQGLNLPLAEVYSLGDKQNKTTAQRDHFINVPPHAVQLFS